MLLAITRHVSASLAECEVTFVDRRPIDVRVARRQHSVYLETLAEAGLEVVALPPLDDLPDATFVEDPFLVLDEVAIALSPGAPSRRAEVDSLVPVMERYRRIERIQHPATIDGGDILRVGRTLFVGRSGRTNDAGIRALADAVSGFGYQVRGVEMAGCLHLKSGCTYIGDRILINPAWIDIEAFADLKPLPVPAREPMAADVLLLPEVIIMSDSFPATRALLEATGHEVKTVDVSEFEKAEAGVTCLSLVFDVGDPDSAVFA